MYDDKSIDAVKEKLVEEIIRDYDGDFYDMDRIDMVAEKVMKKHALSLSDRVDIWNMISSRLYS